jgi:hypothetical protein
MNDLNVLEMVKTWEPEECAQLVRAQCRAGKQKEERDLLLALLARAVHSKNAGESASMEGYREAILAGREIRYKTFEIEVEDEA